MSKYSKKYVMVETEEDEEVEKNDDENKEIKVINNDIYFYTDITKQSILDLTMIIRKLTSSLLKIKYEFNMDPIIKLQWCTESHQGGM